MRRRKRIIRYKRKRNMTRKLRRKRVMRGKAGLRVVMGEENKSRTTILAGKVEETKLAKIIDGEACRSRKFWSNHQVCQGSQRGELLDSGTRYTHECSLKEL